jgi:drug/metabolite transporter (DMT)-like permease
MSSAFLRFALASIFLTGLCRWFLGRWPRLRAGNFLSVAFIAGTGVFLYSYFFFTGLKTVPAGRAAMIVACIPVCLSALCALVYREHFGRVRIFGTLLSLTGVWTVISNGRPLSLFTGGVHPGDLLILGCVLSWTAYSLGGRAIMRVMNPLEAVTWSCILGSLFLFPWALGHLPQDLAAAGGLQWGCLVFLGVLATGLAYFWYYRAIQAIGPSRAGIFINLVPVFAVVLGMIVLGETVHLSLMAGGVMVISGVWLTNRS